MALQRSSPPLTCVARSDGFRDVWAEHSKIKMAWLKRERPVEQSVRTRFSFLQIRLHGLDLVFLIKKRRGESGEPKTLQSLNVSHQISCLEVTWLLPCVHRALFYTHTHYVVKDNYILLIQQKKYGSHFFLVQ